MTKNSGRLADPAWRRRRAQTAARARTSTDYYVGKLVERADDLTNEQVETLRQLLSPHANGGER